MLMCSTCMDFVSTLRQVFAGIGVDLHALCCYSSAAEYGIHTSTLIQNCRKTVVCAQLAGVSMSSLCQLFSGIGADLNAICCESSAVEHGIHTSHSRCRKHCFMCHIHGAVLQAHWHCIGVSLCLVLVSFLLAYNTSGDSARSPVAAASATVTVEQFECMQAYLFLVATRWAQPRHGA